MTTMLVAQVKARKVLLIVILNQVAVLHAVFLTTCTPKQMSKSHPLDQRVAFVLVAKYLYCSKYFVKYELFLKLLVL